MSSRPIASLGVIVLAFGLLIGSGSVAAQDSEDARALGTWDVAGCATRYVTESGIYKVKLPSYCRNGRCEIFFEWGGTSMGAFSPGLGWAIDFIQWPAAANHGWVSGPAINLAGVSQAGGYGTNGDANYEPILGPYVSPDGSYMTLWDDSKKERRPNLVSFQLRHDDPNNREIDHAKLYICKA